MKTKSILHTVSSFVSIKKAAGTQGTRKQILSAVQALPYDRVFVSSNLLRIKPAHTLSLEVEMVSLMLPPKTWCLLYSFKRKAPGPGFPTLLGIAARSCARTHGEI